MSFCSEANRQSGSWLPDVKSCPNRVQPCGNTFCADEAMRASQIRAGNPGFSGKLQANHAEDHALKIATNCQVPPGECPLENFSGLNRSEALKKLAK